MDSLLRATIKLKCINSFKLYSLDHVQFEIETVNKFKTDGMLLQAIYEI